MSLIFGLQNKHDKEKKPNKDGYKLHILVSESAGRICIDNIIVFFRDLKTSI